jgi:3'-phosphoadenosine 5'-phosphosulfate sulfotransferase (PAPS reductase)/FAD synthetase
MSRVVCWFSCGAASAVATYLALKKYGDRAEVVNTYVANEHPDNARFLSDCEGWYGRKIIILRNDDYAADVDRVIEEKRYLSGKKGAPCTGMLKKVPRYKFQRPDDLHVFGYTVEERDRIKRAIEQNPELDMEFPLIDALLTKQDCFAMVNEVGIKLPTMYELGFDNNNCIGCVKAQSPRYWNRIRKHFPEVFERRSEQERQLNYALCRIEKKPVFLDELPIAADNDDGADLSCSLLCQIALNQ